MPLSPFFTDWAKKWYGAGVILRGGLHLAELRSYRPFALITHTIILKYLKVRNYMTWIMLFQVWKIFFQSAGYKVLPPSLACNNVYSNIIVKLYDQIPCKCPTTWHESCCFIGRIFSRVQGTKFKIMVVKIYYIN